MITIRGKTINSFVTLKDRDPVTFPGQLMAGDLQAPVEDTFIHG